MKHVISLGAGVQSTCLALMAKHGEIEPMPEAAIFADTGSEPPEVYEHLDWLMTEAELPFPVYQAKYKHGSLTDHIRQTFERHNMVAGRVGGYLPAPFHARHPDGSAGILRRECTQNYKIDTIRDAVKQLILGMPPGKRCASRTPLVTQWIGISADEIERINWQGPNWTAKRFPFVERAWPREPGELWMHRADCLAWMERHGYPLPPRSACTFCPYRSNREWRNLRDNSPDGWREAVEIDRMIRDMPDSEVAGLRLGGKLYVHRDLVPLEEADIDRDIDERQGNLWSAECEGMCGL